MSRLGLLPTALFATLLGVSGAVTRAVADPAPSPAAASAETPVPAEQDVRAARQAAAAAADDVTAVQAALSAAHERLRRSAIAAAHAEEAYNGARYRARQAAGAARRAADRARVASADLEQQRSAYAATLLADSEMAPQLTAAAALADSHGIEMLLERASTIGNARAALDLQYQRFLAATALAKAASTQASSANRAAQEAEEETAAARLAAQRSADTAAAEAAAIASQRERLVRRLARLQHISVATAAARQRALEQTPAPTVAPIETPAPPVEPVGSPSPPVGPVGTPTPPVALVGTPGPPVEPVGTPSTPSPTPAGGASAAIAFARAQLGEPYRWGAAGPDAWDCSGLTMKAWAAGGKSLPHYSVAQYEQSTPITAGQLQPGDLVFWGDTNSPSSIFHVALYLGGGRILHAPRTGEPVQEASMYYWTPPNFYARP